MCVGEKCLGYLQPNKNSSNHRIRYSSIVHRLLHLVVEFKFNYSRNFKRNGGLLNETCLFIQSPIKIGGRNV